eukprot:11138914-Alexandrium_andersonii.AAC.1
MAPARLLLRLGGEHARHSVHLAVLGQRAPASLGLGAMEALASAPDEDGVARLEDHVAPTLGTLGSPNPVPRLR